MDLKSDFEGYTLSSEGEGRAFNFSPGPAQLPADVIEDIKKDFDKTKLGVTALEISHRSPEFNEIMERVNHNLRDLMKIPEEFAVIWTQGGGHGQFSSIPLNLECLFEEGQRGNYIVTGTWSSRAYNEGSKFVKTYNSFRTDDKNPIEYDNIELSNIKIDKDDAYVYLCSNETVNGLEFRNNGIAYPKREELKSAISIIDMSSDFTMKKVKWEDIDVAFACTSKNLGIAGANVTIIRNNVLQKIGSISKKIPCVLDWTLYNNAKSLYNTPAIYNIYVIDKILSYYLKKGGIEVLESESFVKSKIVYEMLDESELYEGIIKKKSIRSNINIPFIVGKGDAEVRSKFLHYCYNHNIVGLRTKTPFNYEDYNMKEPLRISLYNGISIEDTMRLVDVMRSFEVKMK